MTGNLSGWGSTQHWICSKCDIHNEISRKICLGCGGSKEFAKPNKRRGRKKE